MKFIPKTTDFKLSPYTGMTRESWLEAVQFTLDGIFNNIKNIEDPVVMPRVETDITYPHKWAKDGDLDTEKKASAFEGLTRSFFYGSVMLHNNPGATAGGYRLADYYKKHILQSCDINHPMNVGNYEKLREISKASDPFRCFQQTVETCALVIGLWISKEVIWDTYTRSEKDIIASFLSSFGHANTVPQNWRLFNMLDMAFLYMNGYPIDEGIMYEHATEILAYYVGDGWYQDGQCFDYYSCWAFNVYAPLWCRWYGYEKLPGIAKAFEEHSNKLMETYPDMFDADGWTMMWGRSNIYRNASTSAFDGNMFLKNSNINYGLARRICSGSLLQFYAREDAWAKGIPTLGFYRQFTPLVQGYSCAESVFWMGKAVLCLHLPADHPFWTEKENNGSWEKKSAENSKHADAGSRANGSNAENGNEIANAERAVKVTTLDGPALCFSNHLANGTTILRTGKVTKNIGDRHGMDNYGKLCYSTKYPWEAGINSTQNENTVRTENSEENSNQKEDYNLKENSIQKENSILKDNLTVASMQYVLHDETGDYDTFANTLLWQGAKDEILYRRQYFDYRTDVETHWMQEIKLADFAVPYGIIRADKLRLFRAPVTYTLGAFGFPDNGTEITEKKCSYQYGTDTAENMNKSKAAKAIILKGTDSQGRKKQLAMTIYDGWNDISYVRSCGRNPDSENSIVIYAEGRRTKQYAGFEPKILISQVITKESHEDFSEEELFPIAQIVYSDEAGAGAYGDVSILLKDGTKKIICGTYLLS